MSRRARGDIGDGDGQLFRPGYGTREFGGFSCPSNRGASPSESYTASPGAGPHGFTGCGILVIGLSPLRRHFVPPKVAQVPIPPKWRDDTDPRLPFPSGVSGWFVPVVGAAEVDMEVTGERR